MTVATTGFLETDTATFAEFRRAAKFLQRSRVPLEKKSALPTLVNVLASNGSESGSRKKISNLAGVIATGRHSTALLSELEKRERRLDEISDELLASDGHGIDARLREIEDFVLSRLKDLGGLLAGKIPRAKAEMAKHCTDITLTP